MISDDFITVTTLVQVDQETAFSVFTEEIDSWWRPHLRELFRAGRNGRLHFECGPDGRLLEVYDDDASPFEIGRILSWNPPSRLEFEWRQIEFESNERTLVEIRFEPEGASTRVTVTHSGWEALGRQHPAKLGYEGDALRSMIALRWANWFVDFRRVAAGQSVTAGSFSSR